jgi:flagellar motor switch protein FliN/FliY
MAENQPTQPQGDDAAEAALKAARDAIASLGDLTSGAAAPPPDASPEPAPAPDGARPLDLPTFSMTPSREETRAIELLSDVNLNVKIELGRTRMLVEDVLRLTEGAVVELDKLAGDPVDVYVNDRHVAKGEVLVLNDNFCVRINEIVRGATDGGEGKKAG